MHIKANIQILPISINKAFRGRRFKTQECKNWERDFQYLLQRKKIIKGKVGIIYRFFLHNDKTTDYDNLIKVLQDNLVKAEYIEDDRKIYQVYIEKYPIQKNLPDEIEIQIYPIEIFTEKLMKFLIKKK